MERTLKEQADIFDAIRDHAQAARPRAVEHYRRLHRVPELSWQEEKTAAYIEQVLQGLGLHPRRMGGTGVVVDLDGPEDVSRRALRADIDATTTHEATGLPYASIVPGVMHACGHDGHTAILLGTAEVLVALAPLRRRPLRLVFQPAEEVLPSGSTRLIAEGVLEGVGDIVSLHAWPHLPTGTVGLREGVTTAAADAFEVELRGSGGHGARPHETVDLVALAARIIPVLNDIPRSHFDPLRQPAVVSVGSIHGGESPNVLPDDLRFEGTVRSVDAGIRPEIPAIMRRIVANHAEGAGARYQFTYRSGPPALVNDPALTRLARSVACGILGTHAIDHLEQPSMGSEDFSFYTEQVPGLLLRLGCMQPGETTHPLHSSEFRVDENALPVGVSLLAGLSLF